MFFLDLNWNQIFSCSDVVHCAFYDFYCILASNIQSNVADMLTLHATLQSKPFQMKLKNTQFHGQIRRDETSKKKRKYWKKMKDKSYPTFLMVELAYTQLLLVLVLECRPIRTKIMACNVHATSVLCQFAKYHSVFHTRMYI